MNQTMSLPKDHPLAGALWVGADPACASPVIRRRFCLPRVRQAWLTVTGLGFFEAQLNGQSVTEDRLIPVVSDYEERPLHTFLYPLTDRVTHRIYYCRYEVSQLLTEGENCLSVWLGNGWYRQTERLAEGNVAFGNELKTLFSLSAVTETGETITLCSDGSEYWYESEITYNNLFIGEVIDPAAADPTPRPVTVLPAPQSQLCEQIGTPDRVIRTITPALLGTANGKRIYDAGENISGVVRVAANAPQGERITLRFSEVLADGLALDFASTGADYVCSSGCNQIMTDVFVCDGSQRVFEPRFVWHAFRYFEMEGPGEPEVLVIHSNTPVTARFSSSSEGLNFLFDVYVRTQLNNMHGSIPSDCPHRERLGYTGDGQICAPAAMMLLDTREFYVKWIRDILDCQNIENGHVQHTAPLMGGGGGPCGWGGAMITVPYAFYRQFGDTELLRTCYEPMGRYLDYLEARSENGLVMREEKDGWCLGEWCTPEDTVIPIPYVNSCYLLKMLQIMQRVAAVLGYEQDIPVYARREATVAEAIRRTYRDAQTGSFCGGIQGADAYAVWCGLAGADTAHRLAEKMEKAGCFDTGFLGTDILMEVLFDYGHANTALKLLEREEAPSFLYMKRKGATTIWETWAGEGTVSLDHPMFGACVRQLFQSILGIRQAPDTAGYQTVVLAPCVPAALQQAQGSVCTPRGEIAVAWRQTEDTVTFAVTVPAGVEASFAYQGKTRPLHPGTQTLVIPKSE